MRLQAPAIAHSREERCRFTRPDCFGNTGAAIFTAVAIGISLVHDWRGIGSIHINQPFGRVASAQIGMKACRQTAAFLVKLC